MDDMKKICPNCSQLYNLKSLSPLKGNLPLFLSCGHSMCENCIKNIVKFAEPIECKVCHRDMNVETIDMGMLAMNEKNIYQVFPINVYMVGELVLQHGADHTTEADEDYFIDIQAIINSTEQNKGKCIECQIVTSKMCKQCEMILCESCFTKTHKNFVVFKNHSLQFIEASSKDCNCKQHNSKALDYYCKTCLKSVCMDCMMVGGEKSCKNHDVVSMQEVSEGFLNEINDVAPKVNEIFKRLTKTAVDIGNLLHNIDNETSSSSEYTQIIANVEQHFSKLNSIVQKHKSEVMGIINKVKHSEKESLQNAKKSISDAIKKTKIVLNSINSSLEENKTKQMNLSVLLEEAMQIADTPWYLVKDQEKEKDPLKVTVNEDLCTLLSDYIQFDGNVKCVYKLMATSQIGDDVEIPPPPTNVIFPPDIPKDVRQLNKKKIENTANALTFHKEAPKYRSKCGSNTSLNSIASESSCKGRVVPFGESAKLVHPVSPFSESNQSRPFHEGTQEVIYISHIVDPHNFYVQRSCHQGLVKEMLREFRNAKSLPKPSQTHVAGGKLYLGYNKVDNLWQRCRVVSIDNRDETTPRYHVFYIDFGSTDVVSIDSLRLLTPAKQSQPALAINCALANCEPRAGAWNSDDAFLIQNIIANKQAVIHIRRIRSTSDYRLTLECDVTTVEDGVSLAHALVFHERARMPNTKLQYPKAGLVEKPKVYINNNDFKFKSIEYVFITQIVSPDKFFVRKSHLQAVYNKLCEDMTMEYSMNPKAGTVYLPEPGVGVAVNVSKYQAQTGDEGGTEWARGIVHETPGRSRVRVLLPDSGALLLVHWSALRRLQPQFTKLQALATECHLAGVTPMNKKWSPASLALLQHFEGRLLELHVEDVRNRNSIGVTLYDKADKANIICVNNEMIKNKFAITFGLFMFNQKNTLNDQVYTNKSPLDEPKVQVPKTKKIEILKKPKSSTNTEESDLDAKDKGPLRLEAKLLNYQTPSLLYVSLVHQQKTFNELFENMQKYYMKKKTYSKEGWKEGDRCCAPCSQSKTWRRAVILELENNTAKLFYSDFAVVETVPLPELRELTPEFAKIGDAAIKCHLCGVLPAVGEEWPSVTKEFLKELFEAYPRVFITKSGNFKDKSMPVEVWVYHTVQGGALEPNVSEWRCLNNKIIEQGLGVPDGSDKDSNLENQNAERSDEILSFLNVTGSVHDWLQLEPMPTKRPIKPDSVNNSTPTNVDDEVEDNGPSTSDTVFISNWLPPEALPATEFTGMPTYIDNYGIIYLHDISQQDTLDLIRKALDVRFKGPDPKAKFSKWTVGEPCIALFFLDNRFYRGRVMEVDNDTSTCLIHYIDYGNEELCLFENMRKSIALYQIPTQAHKCLLNRIRPSGGKSWDRITLDYIHKSIVEKQCLVKITGEPINDVTPIDLKYDKLWINDHLVDFEMAEYTDGSKPVVRKFVPISPDSTPDYIVEDDTKTSDGLSTPRGSVSDMQDFKKIDWNKMIEEEEKGSPLDLFITYPRNPNSEFMCNIAIINDVKVLQLSVIHDDETNLIYQDMFEIVQNESINRPQLNGFLQNKACVALFHEDGEWYRASILEYSEKKGLVKVRYVDYGNIEVIALDEVREICEEWTALPPGTIAAKLHGIELSPDIDVKKIVEVYADTFLNKGPFHAKIINYENSVPYVDLRDDSGNLVYKNLIESGIFIKDEIYEKH